MTEIHIFGSQSKLVDCPMHLVSAVDAVTSYPVAGAVYSKAFKKGHWDGRKRLLKKRGMAFPTGLVPAVQRALQVAGEPVEVLDYRPVPEPAEAGFELSGVSFDHPYEYELETAEKMIKAKNGIIKIATNGGKTEIACAVTQYLGLYTLFVVTTRDLLYQGQERFMKRLQLTEEEVGIVGDGKWLPGSKVTIATVDTLESRINTTACQDLIKKAEVLFLDECHHVGSETWYTVSTLCHAYYRFGMSGTPLDRTDGANLRLIAATGELLVDIGNKFLVDRGISARAHIIFDKVVEPVLKKRIRYNTAYKQGVVENPHMLQKVLDWVKIFYKAGLGTLVLCEEIQHGRMIDDALWTDVGEVFIPHQFIYGDEDSDIRKKALADFANGDLPVLVASTILDEGVDVPTIDALVLAGSRKSRIRTMQRLGRGLRGKKLLVVDFANFTNKYLVEHSLQRLEDFKAEECFPIYYSSPDVELVRKLWNDEGTGVTTG